MIQINFCQPSSIILADLERHVVMDAFLQGVLSTLGIELRWEYLGEYITDHDNGLFVYRHIGRRLAEIKYVERPSGTNIGEFSSAEPQV